MKRFLSINLLILTTLGAAACAWQDTHNFYLFSLYNRQTFADRTEQLCQSNWNNYTGTDAAWFDADDVRRAAKEKNDALMTSYVNQLVRYQDCASQTRQDRWEYPTKAQLAKRKRTLEDIRLYAQQKLKTRLRSQHALLFMRCNMMLGRHQENISFWQQSASKYIETVYRDMMRNIYAGALLKTGRRDEALAIFAEQGDTESLYTYFYKKRTLPDIRSEYLRDPNAPTLPFLLQDFANNAQEVIDQQQNSWNIPGMLYYHELKEAECRTMIDFAHQVVIEGYTSQPALWKSLEAWLEFLFGNRSRALAAIREATTLAGQPRTLDNARALQLYITAATLPVASSLDNFLATELAWLNTKASEERGSEQWYGNHYTEVFDRLVFQQLVPRYDQAGRTAEATAFLAVYDELPKAHSRATVTPDNDNKWNDDYNGSFFCRLDTMPVRQLEKYAAFIEKKPTTKLERWLTAHLRHDNTYMHELMGTKYLRLAQWQQAISHLEQVPLTFINQQNIAPFMAQRTYTKERWMGRQLIAEERQQPGTAVTQENQKLVFAREMLQLENGRSVLAADQRWQRDFDLATRYFQASYLGDAWYLTRYGHSVMDTARTDERDFVAIAAQLLENVARTAKPANRERALFALAYTTGGEWYTDDWDDQKGDIVRTARPRSAAYRALARLADYEQQNGQQPATYVSRCDNYRQFLRQYRH